MNRHRFSRMNPLLQICFLVWPSILLAEYQAGLDAYSAGDYATAMTEWKEEVAGEPEPENLAVYRETLYAIAMLYWQGQGVGQDYAVSAAWLKQAADINHPGAQTKLGYLYTQGEGVPQNYQEAIRWFQMAAAQGDPDAVHNLDIMFDQGFIAQESGEPEKREQKRTEPPVTAAPAPNAASDHGENWILRQDPGHYTIQVIALRQPEKLHAFIAGHEDWAPFAIYRQSRYAEPLWVMVQGVYPDVESARAARDAFPGGLQKTGELWIRKFGMVQRLIK